MQVWTNTVKWSATLVLLASLTACGGAKKDSLLEAQPVSEAEKAAAEQQAEAPLVNNTIQPDQGAAVQVLDAGAGANTNASNIDAGQDLTAGSELVSEQKEVVKTYEPVIFFDYDQYDISEEALSTVKHYAEILMENEALKLTLMGHTDERGTPEYNLALGERRSRATQEAFMLFGVAQGRIEALSMGEEQPLIDEHNEAAYAKNRRVEIGIH